MLQERDGSIRGLVKCFHTAVHLIVCEFAVCYCEYWLVGVAKSPF